MEKKQEELMVLVKEKDEIEEAIKLLNIKLDELNKKGIYIKRHIKKI